MLHPLSATQKMKDLIQHIKSRIKIAAADEALIASKFFKKTVGKRTFLLQEGEVNMQLSYVHKGCLRIYAVDDNGFEKNVFFGLEDWWCRLPIRSDRNLVEKNN